MFVYSPYPVVLRAIDFFVASEEVNWPDVSSLAERIAARGVWSAPLPVERDSGIVMDGNHRLQAARILGLSHLPCILLSYDMPGVRVTQWDSDAQFPVAQIFRTIRHDGAIFPYKSTRHTFNPALPNSLIELSALRRGIDAANQSAPAAQRAAA
jgi:hypothetical protein